MITKNIARLFLCSVSGCSCFLFSLSQNKTDFRTNQRGLQFGFSGKITAEAGTKARPAINLRFSLNVGVASEFIDKWMYPSLNMELQAYNGGFGSRNHDGQRGFCMDVITAMTVTAGIRNQFVSTNINLLARRNVPLYYFANFAQPALQNPFQHSFSVGTNYIFSTDGNKSSQRIGFINLHIWRFQLSYYNDGGVPIADIYLGDRRDRYYTGGATLSYNGKRNTLPETVELGFYKYTGYTKNAFEVSNKLNLAYVHYRNQEQKFYNRSLWSLNLASPSKGFGINLRTFNYVDQDFQHAIHWKLSDAYHMVPYPAHWVISGSYYSSYTKTGLR
jgi:hypothetical protein